MDSQFSINVSDPVPDMASLLGLPSELIHHILGYLDLSDLISIGCVNKALHEHSIQDTLWQPFVQAEVPNTVPKPSNQTWRELFQQHHPYWFLAKRKIWFADTQHTGKLLIARYDHRINAIEAYAVVAERRQPTLLSWDEHPEAIVHSFNPRIQLDLNSPVVRLNADAYDDAIGSIGYRLQKEVPMSLYREMHNTSAGLYSQLMLTRPWPKDITIAVTPVWPPLTLPSIERARNDPSPSGFRQPASRPSSLDQLSTSTFRLRKWMEFSSRPYGVSMRIGEDITTYATLPEECYTPTPQKPWQGIWCGNYEGHGCEFLVVMQPDDPEPLPPRAEWTLRGIDRDGSVSSADSWNTAPTDAIVSGEGGNAENADDLEDSITILEEPFHETRLSSSSAPDDVGEMDDPVYRGRIEAVKLTGDPNIPRGEYTFIAPDIGSNGLLRIADKGIFKGARIVRSVGHIAARGFRDDDYMTSQLILISHDEIAQYWEAFGHVSFYQRVNIDEFTRV